MITAIRNTFTKCCAGDVRIDGNPGISGSPSITPTIRHLEDRPFPGPALFPQRSWRPAFRLVADRIIFMADGAIVEEGPAASVVGSPQMERTQQFLSAVIH